MKDLLTLTIPGPDGPQELLPPSGVPSGGLSGDGGKVLGFGITIFLIVCVILALGMTIYGGLNWITSQGDKTKIESARRMVIFSLVGLLVAFLSFFGISLFGSLFGIDLLNLTL